MNLLIFYKFLNIWNLQLLNSIYSIIFILADINIILPFIYDLLFHQSVPISGTNTWGKTSDIRRKLQYGIDCITVLVLQYVVLYSVQFLY